MTCLSIVGNDGRRTFRASKVGYVRTRAMHGLGGLKLIFESLAGFGLLSCEFGWVRVVILWVGLPRIIQPALMLTQ